MNSNNPKIVIQHRHRNGEIAGVISYIDSLEEEFKIRGIESRIISTAETNCITWFINILWSDVVYMNSNNPSFALLSRLLFRKVFLIYHYKFYLTECSLKNIGLGKRLMIELNHLKSIKNLPWKWKLERVLQLFKLGGRLAASYLANELLANTKFMALNTYLPRNIHVFPFPCPKNSTTVLKELKDLSTPYTFTFAGRLCREKGVDILLESLKRLASSHSDFLVNIVGNGNMSGQFHKMAEELQLNSHVKFLGKLTLEETMQLMRSSIAVIIPSRCQESAGRVLLEAATVGTAVIASRVGGLPELGGSDCLYFEKEDVEGLYQAMAIYLNSPQDALESGLRLQARVQEEHSVSKHVDNLLHLFRA